MPDAPVSVPEAATPPIAVPYSWFNFLLLSLIVGLLVLSLGLLIYSFFTRQFPRRRVRVLSLGAFGAMLATGAANYAVIFLVMLPALAVQGVNASLGSRTAVGDPAPTSSVRMIDPEQRNPMPDSPVSVPESAPLPIAVPYAWLSPILVNLMLGLFVLSFGLLVYSFLTRRFPKRRLRYLSLGAFGAMFAMGAANYAVIFLVIFPALAAQGENASRGSRTAVGDRAPTFSVQMIDGTTRSPDDLRGKVVVVNFFATWCGPCVLELPHLQKVYDKYRGRHRFEMLVIGREETLESVQEFVREHEWTFPAAADPERKAFERFADNGIPRVYVIDHDGRIAFQSIGFTERGIARLEEAIEGQLKVLATAPPSEPPLRAE